MRLLPLGTLICGLVLAGCRREPAPLVQVEVGDLARLEGEVQKLRGKAVLLNFWAIWCAPCVAELPDLDKTLRAFADRGGTVLAVSYDLMLPKAEREATVQKVREFLQHKGYAFTAFVYDAPDYDAINARFDLPGGVPVTLAIDAAGRIVGRHEGEADLARFTELMQKALAR